MCWQTNSLDNARWLVRANERQFASEIDSAFLDHRIRMAVTRHLDLEEQLMTLGLRDLDLIESVVRSIPSFQCLLMLDLCSERVRIKGYAAAAPFLLLCKREAFYTSERNNQKAEFLTVNIEDLPPVSLWQLNVNLFRRQVDRGGHDRRWLVGKVE